MMHPFIRDLTFSFRSMRRSPGFTAAAVLTLTLGIAGNSLVFSVINATLLRPLPYPDPNRLVILRWQDQADLSSSGFFMVKKEARCFSLLAALYPVDVGVNVSAAGPPQYVKALSVSKDFFQTLGVTLEIGRYFSPEEDQPKAPRVAVLSFGLWTQKFNRAPSVLGSQLRVNGEEYNIIGVMPQSFHSYPDADVWFPLQLTPGSADPGGNYRVIGRLKDGVSRAQAQHELDILSHQYHSIYQSSPRKGTLIAYDLQTFLVERERPGLAILLTAVAFVFLIACSNVAILILVRTTASAQAIAIRAALGPSRRRLVVSLLNESFLLSLIAGLLGLILTKESLPLLVSLWPAELPFASRLAIDWRVVSFTFALSLLSPLFFGLLPAFKLSRVNIAQVLARSSRTASASLEQVRAVRLLVFSEMALTVMLLAGTLLLLKSLLNLYSVPLGFNPHRLIVAQVSLSDGRYTTTVATDRLLDQVLRQLKTLPGVEEVAAVNGLPLDNGLNLALHPVEQPSVLDHDDQYRPVTSDYFKTLRVSLRSGRFFSSSDFSGSAPVAIINETMARRWWPNASAIGHYLEVTKQLGPQFTDGPRQIVGIISDIREKGPALPPPTTVFVPMPQTPDRIMAFSNKTFLTSIVVRTSGSIDLPNQIRSAIRSADADLPVASFRTFSQIVDRSLANPRFIAFLTVAFSMFALLLSALGTQGLLNYQARLRAREIAVRMTVGATRSRIITMVLYEGTRLISMAVLAGLAGALLIKRLTATLLYNVQGGSTLLIFTTGLLVGSLATLISFLTAVRAASVEPVAVLRNE